MSCNAKHTCAVPDCSKPRKGNRSRWCSMHSARWYRNGTLEKVRQRPEKGSHSCGYSLLYRPNHPRAHATGWGFEHRIVYFDQISEEISECAICSCSIDWDTCHIDHINENKKDNRPENLQALCGSCNPKKSAPITKIKIKERQRELIALGVSLTLSEWMETGLVSVKRSTVWRRIDKGMSDHDALFKEKRTWTTKK